MYSNRTFSLKLAENIFNPCYARWEEYELNCHTLSSKLAQNNCLNCEIVEIVCSSLERTQYLFTNSSSNGKINSMGWHELVRQQDITTPWNPLFPFQFQTPLVEGSRRTMTHLPLYLFLFTQSCRVWLLNLWFCKSTWGQRLELQLVLRVE